MYRIVSHLDETIHKVTSLSATYDTIIKPPSTVTSTASSTTVFATRQQMKDRVPLFNDT